MHYELYYILLVALSVGMTVVNMIYISQIYSTITNIKDYERTFWLLIISTVNIILTYLLLFIICYVFIVYYTKQLKLISYMTTLLNCFCILSSATFTNLSSYVIDDFEKKNIPSKYIDMLKILRNMTFFILILLLFIMFQKLYLIVTKESHDFIHDNKWQ